MFEDKVDLIAYIDGDKIKCLECGRWFRGLGTHIVQAHDMTAADYKQKHGIPQKVGLVGTETRQIKASLTKSLHNSGKLSVETAHSKRPVYSKSRKKPPYQQKKFFQRGLEVNKANAYPNEIYEEYLRRLETVRSLQSVSNDSDMPSIVIIYRRARKEPEFSARLKAITKQNKSILIKQLRATEKEQRERGGN